MMLELMCPVSSSEEVTEKRHTRAMVIDVPDFAFSAVVTGTGEQKGSCKCANDGIIRNRFLRCRRDWSSHGLHEVLAVAAFLK